MASGHLKGIVVSPACHISHLLFLNDILIFFEGAICYVEHLEELLNIFCKSTGMLINKRKSSLYTCRLSKQRKNTISKILSLQAEDLGPCLKYLPFMLKANDYQKNDWLWLLAKFERKVNAWCNKWLSRVRQLVLVKAILEAILVYWTSVAWIPKDILGKIRQLTYRFL